MSLLPELLIAVSDEVERALEHGGPVVALESSVIAQGLPHPENLACARACEAAIREEGAIPATIAVVDGVARVGLDAATLERLATERGLAKLGERDLGVAVAKRLTGGTTVSATLCLADLAGVAVFATGGIGGVHRGDASDVSADLPSLAKHAVAVVCAGAKSILDLPRTLETLETLGVPVIGLRTGEFPAFYADRSNLPLEHRVETERELSLCAQAHWDLGGGGVLAVQPCPPEHALPAAEIEVAVAAALAKAVAQNVVGKAITPFLLGEVAAVTKGRSKAANLALLENNARAAARLAIALAG